MAKLPNYTVGARGSSRVSNVYQKKKYNARMNWATILKTVKRELYGSTNAYLGLSPFQSSLLITNDLGETSQSGPIVYPILGAVQE